MLHRETKGERVESTVQSVYGLKGGVLLLPWEKRYMVDCAGARELWKSLFFLAGEKKVWSMEVGVWSMEYGGVPCFFCARKRILGMGEVPLVYSFIL